MQCTCVCVCALSLAKASSISLPNFPPAPFLWHSRVSDAARRMCPPSQLIAFQRSAFTLTYIPGITVVDGCTRGIERRSRAHSRRRCNHACIHGCAHACVPVSSPSPHAERQTRRCRMRCSNAPLYKLNWRNIRDIDVATPPLRRNLLEKFSATQCRV